MKKPRGQRPAAPRPETPRPALAAPKVAAAPASARIAPAGDAPGDGALVRVALGFTSWAERWFPDAFVFVAIAVVVVALGALANGAPVDAVTKAFGDGFWSLIPFTMQMAFVTIGGYVVATSPPAQKLIDRLALIPKTGRGAVGFIAAISMLASLLSWGLSLIFGGLLARAIARRTDLRMDYRAAGAAAYLGLGATWALGLSSSAAQLQANAASLPKTLLPITGVIPFTETIFLWQSMVMAARADRALDRDRDLVGAVGRQRRDRARPRRRSRPAPGGAAATPAAGRVARAFAAAHHPAGGAGAGLADPGIRPPERHRRDLEPEHLQFPVPDAGPAAALAAQALPQCGREVGAGDDRRADPVPVLCRHQLHPDRREEPGRRTRSPTSSRTPSSP